MSTYKTFFIPTTQIIEKKMDKHMGYKVDGLALNAELQALLFEYEQKGYDLISIEAITSTYSSFTYTEGLTVIMRLKEIKD